MRNLEKSGGLNTYSIRLKPMTGKNELGTSRWGRVGNIGCHLPRCRY